MCFPDLQLEKLRARQVVTKEQRPPDPVCEQLRFSKDREVGLFIVLTGEMKPALNFTLVSSSKEIIHTKIQL